MEKIGILVLSLLVTAMMFTGVALAAQTSYSLNVTGNSFTDVDFRMDTPMGLPYEMEGYSLDMFIVDGKDAAYTHYLDVDSGVEAKTTLVAGESDGVILIDESVRKDVIGDVVVNENVSAAHCYSGSAGYSVVGSNLNYESAAQVTGMGVDYTVSAAGNGNMRWVSEEYLASGEIVQYVDNSNESDTNEENGGDVNEEDIPAPGEGASTFWTNMYAKEDVRANGIFEFEGSYHSEFSNFPAPAPDEEIGKMCPFGNEWN